MHYFIAHFLSSESFNAKPLNSVNPIDAPILKVINSLRLSFFKFDSAMDSLAEAETIEFQGQNQFLLLLFLELRAKLSIAVGRHAEGIAIISQIKSIITDEMPAEYKVIPLTCEGCLFLQEGKSKESEIAIEECLNLLNTNSERYQFLLLENSMQLSIQCRLIQKKDVIDKIYKTTKNSSLKTLAEIVLCLFYLNKCELNSDFQSKLIFENQSDISKFYFAEIIEAKKMELILKFNSNLLKENDLLLELNKNIFDLMLAYYHLLKKAPNEAFMILQSSTLNSSEIIKKNGMISFLPIRVELSCGRMETARSLLVKKNEAGNFHFFDQFFWARIEYLAGNIDKAKSHFKTVYENCVKNNCMMRLEFEIELTFELKYKDIQKFWEYAKDPSTVSTNINPEVITIPEKHFEMLGESLELKSVFENIHQYAPLDLPVLIIGETGTGKELTAQALHQESNRKDKPYLAINCGAISEYLLQSELFGYEQGAFTGASKSRIGILEAAGNGTVFLDEIGEISPAVQVALLRVLENNEIRPVGGTKSRKLNCRIIAATNAPLDELVEKNRFRKDLYYRLQRLQISLPSLRERKEDIKSLAIYYLSKERGSQKISISDKFIEAIQKYNWPGNIRELRNEMERIALMNLNKNNFNELDLNQNKFHTTILELEIYKKETIEDDKLEIKPEVMDNTFEQEYNLKALDEDNDFQNFLNSRNSSIRRKVKLKEYFIKYQSLSRSEVARVMNLALNTAAKDLAELEKEGFIERIMPNTSARTHYFTLVKK
jgi:transcriptional regulator with PAS, ATPase and Fis domain